jgi:hypothetical protein
VNHLIGFSEPSDLLVRSRARKSLRFANGGAQACHDFSYLTAAVEQLLIVHDGEELINWHRHIPRLGFLTEAIEKIFDEISIGIS